MPAIHINFLAMILSVLVSFIFGFLWYGPFFGKTWAALAGVKMEESKPEAWRFIVSIIGTVFTCYVMTYTVQGWMPAVWGVGNNGPWHTYSFFAGLFTWVGFYIPLLLSSVTWENKPWELFYLNAAYYFLNLQIIAAILAYLR